MIFVLFCDTLIKHMWTNKYIWWIFFYQRRIDKVNHMDEKYYILNNVKIKCYLNVLIDKLSQTTQTFFSVNSTLTLTWFVLILIQFSLFHCQQTCIWKQLRLLLNSIIFVVLILLLLQTFVKFFHLCRTMTSSSRIESHIRQSGESYKF